MIEHIVYLSLVKQGVCTRIDYDAVFAGAVNLYHCVSGACVALSQILGIRTALREQLAQPFSVLADVSGMVYLAARTRGRYRLVKSLAACVCRQRGSRNRLAGLNDAVKLVDIIYIT